MFRTTSPVFDTKRLPLGTLAVRELTWVANGVLAVPRLPEGTFRVRELATMGEPEFIAGAFSTRPWLVVNELNVIAVDAVRLSD